MALASTIIHIPANADKALLEGAFDSYGKLGQLHYADLHFTLPLPPSLNNQYVTRIVKVRDKGGHVRLVAKRFASSDLRRFKAAVPEVLHYEYRIEPHAHPWPEASHIVYQALVIVPTKRSDLLNRLKAAEDAFATYLGFDDQVVVEVHTRKLWGKGYGPPRIIFHMYIK